MKSRRARPPGPAAGGSSTIRARPLLLAALVAVVYAAVRTPDISDLSMPTACFQNVAKSGGMM